LHSDRAFQRAYTVPKSVTIEEVAFEFVSVECNDVIEYAKLFGPFSPYCISYQHDTLTLRFIKAHGCLSSMQPKNKIADGIKTDDQDTGGMPIQLSPSRQ
jgi:hypothetical protein